MADDSNKRTSGSLSLFLTVRFVSGVFLGILATLTIVANIALLVTLWKKRTRTFQTPANFFVLGIAVADLITGMVVEPAFSICYMSNDLNKCKVEIVEIIQYLPRMFINCSFLIVLLQSWSHFLAITRPHFYKRFLTKMRVIAIVTGVFMYTTGFSFLQFSGISHHLLLMIDVYLHATAIPMILMVAYVFMLVNLRAHMRRRDAFFTRGRCDVVSGAAENPASTINIEDNVERQFIRMNLCLTVGLLTCTLPSIVVMHIALNASDASIRQQTNLAVAQNIAEDILFIKFALDPFIFTWNFQKMGSMWRSIALSRNSSPALSRHNRLEATCIEATSFPGSLSYPSRSVGRVGENPGNEVGFEDGSRRFLE